MKTPFCELEDCELISDFLDLDYCFISKEEVQNLSDKDQKIWKDKKTEAFGIIDNLFIDKRQFNHFLYNTDIEMLPELWRPLCASNNHSPRFKHIISTIILEIDWRSKSLRCEPLRYRFYVEDLEGKRVKPYLLATNSERMAQMYINKIDALDYGSSLQDIAQMLSLFFSITYEEYKENTGDISILGFGKNIRLEVMDYMMLLEDDDLAETYLTEPYERDNVEVLGIVKDILVGKLV